GFIHPARLKEERQKNKQKSETSRQQATRVRHTTLKAEHVQHPVHRADRCGRYRKPQLLVNLLHRLERRHLHAGGQNDRVHTLRVYALDVLGRSHRILAAHFQVVGDLERHSILNFNAFVLDVVHHQLSQRLHVWSQDRHLLRTHRVQTLHQSTRAGYHWSSTVVVHGNLVQTLFRFAVVAKAHAHDCY